MRIKQIELNGFKSFMERTVLELPAGVTAVVGPNGCGKSNIVDAIRWVLGEQSPRHLRGEAMEDVIFTGNTENGPLGMAGVALLLGREEADFARGEPDGEGEAAADGLPPELATASEILVSRRYFRSGESEYAINRAPCRLKDITELFLGTGVGTKAYAIIEQGRVDQLINAKPEELRLFIEEAAGTTRFRSRKVAAERKMERTRENLLRVQDILRELERQMASLERQARRAEEYHRIKQELRELDLRVMAVRQRSWSAEVATLGERLGALQAEEAAAAEAIRQRRGALDEAHAARATNEERLRAVEEELTAERLAAAEAQARSGRRSASGATTSRDAGGAWRTSSAPWASGCTPTRAPARRPAQRSGASRESGGAWWPSGRPSASCSAGSAPRRRRSSPCSSRRGRRRRRLARAPTPCASSRRATRAARAAWRAWSAAHRGRRSSRACCACRRTSSGRWRPRSGRASRRWSCRTRRRRSTPSTGSPGPAAAAPPGCPAN